MNITQCLTAVMAEVGSVRKAEQNTHQHFNFRGIDTVVNAVSPALREFGVVVVPEVIESHYGSVEVGNKRTLMGHARLLVRYTFHGPDGDSLTTTVAAEAMDSGDKATAKAMSVAFRTALLQALCLPTDEADPDAETFQRSEPFDEAAYLQKISEENEAATTVDEVRALWQKVAQSPLTGETRDQLLTALTAKGETLAEPKDES